MENSGRKRKVSGTILAGAFTVPAAMSAAQQNVTSANFFTEAATSVSDLFTKRTLNSFLKCAAYVILPSIALVAFGVFAYYAYKYYNGGGAKNGELEGDMFVEDEIGEEDEYSEDISPEEWKIFTEKKEPGYNERESCLIKLLEENRDKLGFNRTKIKVDSKVLEGILDEGDLKEDNEISDLLNKEKTVTFVIEGFESGRFRLRLKNDKEDEDKETQAIYTKFLATDKTNKFINLFNKIFEKSRKQNYEKIRLVLEQNGESVLLKTKGAGEDDVEINISKAEDEESIKKISLLRESIAYDFVEGEYDFLNGKLNNIKYTNKIKTLLNKIKVDDHHAVAKVGVIKKILEGTEDKDEIKKENHNYSSLAKFCEMCKKQNITDDKELRFTIKSVSSKYAGGTFAYELIIDGMYKDKDKDKGDEKVYFTTKPLKNDIGSVIHFLNNLEGLSEEEHTYCRFTKEGNSVFRTTYDNDNKVIKKEKLTEEGFKEIEDENNIELNINNDVFNINNNINNNGNGGEGDTENINDYRWNIFSKEEKEIFSEPVSLLWDIFKNILSSVPKVGNGIKVKNKVLISMLPEKDNAALIAELRDKGNEETFVDISGLNENGGLDLQITSANSEGKNIDNKVCTKFAVNDIDRTIAFFNYVFALCVKNTEKIVTFSKNGKGDILLNLVENGLINVNLSEWSRLNEDKEKNKKALAERDKDFNRILNALKGIEEEENKEENDLHNFSNQDDDSEENCNDNPFD